MSIKTKLLLVAMLLCICTSLKAQIEAAYLKSKDYNGFGAGGFLGFSIPVTDNGSIAAEAGLYYSVDGDNDQVGLFPFLVGYRVMLAGLNSDNGYGDEDYSSGFYIQPVAGYTIGGTNIPRTDSTGQQAVDNNGNYIDEKASGITSGIIFGYIFPGNFQVNIGIRYEHVFVPSPDPSMNLISIRLSHPLFPRRRD